MILSRLTSTTLSLCITKEQETELVGLLRYGQPTSPGIYLLSGPGEVPRRRDLVTYSVAINAADRESLALVERIVGGAV